MAEVQDQKRETQSTPGDAKSKADETLVEEPSASVDETLVEPDMPVVAETLREEAARVADETKVEAAEAQAGRPAPEPTAASPTEPKVWKVGNVIEERYEVRGVLGVGGMGKVYHVYDKVQALDLAMKTPVFVGDAATRQNLEDRFINEALAWIGLGMHLHIVACCYVRRVAGRLRLFLEYVPGQSLQDRLDAARERGETLPLREVLDIGIQLCWALEHVHKRGIVHRDVKPSNILIYGEGEEMLVKLTDFGIVKAAGTPEVKIAGTGVQLGAAELSHFAGGFVGTPAYAAPEQFLSPDKVGPASDVYSVGVVLYELLTGRWPVGEEHRQADARALASLFRRSHAQATTPARDVPLPEAIQEVLWRCLAQEVGERYVNVTVLGGVLQTVYEQLVGQAYTRTKPPKLEALADVLNNRAFSLLGLGYEEKAGRLLNEAMRLEPNHPEVAYNYSVLQWKLGKMTDDQVIHRLVSIQKSLPKEWIWSYLIGLIHLGRGDQENAQSLLESALIASNKNYLVKRALQEANAQDEQWIGCLRVFNTEACVSSIFISPDSRFALSGDKHSNIQMWDLARGECSREFQNITTKNGVDSLKLILVLPDCQHGLVSNGIFFDFIDINTGERWHKGKPPVICLDNLHGEKSTSTSVTPDGKLALCGTEDTLDRVGFIRLHCLESNSYLYTFGSIWGGVNSVSISSDGKLGVSGGMQGFLLWNTENGILKWFKEGIGEITSVMLSSDGKFLLCGGKDNDLSLWNVDTEKCVKVFTGHTDRVNCIAFFPNKPLALSGSADKTLRIWNLDTGQCLRTLTGHTEEIMCISISTNGKLVLSGSADGTLRIWKIGGTKKVSFIPAFQDLVDIHRTSSEFLSLLDNAKQAFEMNQLKTAIALISKAREIPGYCRLAIAIDLKFKIGQRGIRCGLQDSWLAGVFDIGAGVTSLSTSFDSSDKWLVFLGDNLGQLHLWDMTTRKCLRTFYAYSKMVLDDVYSKEIVSVAISSANCEVGILSVKFIGFKAYVGNMVPHSLLLCNPFTGETLKALWETNYPKNYPIQAVSISSDGRLGVSTSWDKNVRLWELNFGKCVKTLEHSHIEEVLPLGQVYKPQPEIIKINSVTISSDGKFGLSGSDDHTIRLWDFVTGNCQRVLVGHKGPINSVAFSPHGQHGLSGSDDHTVRLWNLSTGHCKKILVGHTGPVTSVAFSIDGQFGLSGSYDKTIRLWDLMTGRCLKTLEGHTGPITSLAFSPNGRYGISGSLDKTMRLWEFDWIYEFPDTRDWDERARTYLKNFLALHTPYAGALPQDREPTEEEIWLALTRRGKPTWSEVDFEQLLYTLGCAGYGWLRPEGVRRELEKMAETCNGPPPLVAAPPTEATALQETSELEPLIEAPILPETPEFGSSPTPPKLTVWQRLRRWWKRRTQ